MTTHLKVAVIGDQFVGTELFVDALHRHLAPFAGELDVVTMSVPWPDTPLRQDDEVKEYLGDPAAVARLARDVDVLLTHVAPVTQQLFDAAPMLRIVGCCRGGPVNINVAAATARGIPVVNAPARNSQAVVEFTVGLILAECRGIARAHAALSQGVWLGDLYRYDRTGRELRGQTIGLVGFGAIAQSLVAYLRPLWPAHRCLRSLLSRPRALPSWRWNLSICRCCWRVPTLSACTRASRRRPPA